MKKLIPKHLEGNTIKRPFVKTKIPLRPTLWNQIFNRGFKPSIEVSYPIGWEDYKTEDGNSKGHVDVTFTNWQGEPRKGVMRKDYIEDSQGNRTYGSGYFPGREWRNGEWHEAPGEILEREATTNYIKQHNSNLPWWYEGSPENPLPLPGLEVVGDFTPVRRTVNYPGTTNRWIYSIDQNGNFVPIGYQHEVQGHPNRSFLVNGNPISYFNPENGEVEILENKLPKGSLIKPKQFYQMYNSANTIDDLQFLRLLENDILNRERLK